MTRYAIVTREFAFEISYSVPLTDGQCQHPHRLTYRLQIALRSPILEQRGESNNGIAMDMEKLSQTMNMLLFATVPCGSLNQNDLDMLSGTIAPNLVHWIWDALVAAGVPDHLLYRVRLWETEEGYTEITHQERETYGGFE